MDGRSLYIDVIKQPICYSEFFHRYLEANQPCVLSEVWTDSWPCRKLWVKDGRPDWDFLKKNYGSAQVPVADCGVQYYDSHRKTDWNLGDYTDYITKYRSAGYPASEKCLYLKDFHFAREFPTANIYHTPCFFASDWLNEHWVSDNKTDDYRFVYIGPQGSWTPFHSDVYGSYSWSANVIGKKRWILIPAGQEEKLRANGHLPGDIGKADLKSAGVDSIDVIQHEGQVIFVPSGWYHQVWNLDDTISINHNWFNGSNIEIVYRSLFKAYREVQKELHDFAIDHEFRVQVESVLRCHHGMNFEDFINLLESVVRRRNEGHLRIHHPSLSCVCDKQDLCSDEIHRDYDLKIALDMIQRLKQMD